MEMRTRAALRCIVSRPIPGLVMCIRSEYCTNVCPNIVSVLLQYRVQRKNRCFGVCAVVRRILESGMFICCTMDEEESFSGYTSTRRVRQAIVDIFCVRAWEP